MGDKYRNFARLAKKENARDYRPITIDRDSEVVIIAIHGGKIEPGTSQIAEAIAGDHYSLYRFEGLKQKGGNKALHIKSTHFDEPECIQLVERSGKVLSVHGKRGKQETVFVGGRDAKLKAQIIHTLKAAGFRVKEDTTATSAMSSKNVCNKGRSRAGVQLEITRPLRESMLGGVKATRLPVFVNAVRGALE